MITASEIAEYLLVAFGFLWATLAVGLFLGI